MTAFASALPRRSAMLLSCAAATLAQSGINNDPAVRFVSPDERFVSPDKEHTDQAGMLIPFGCSRCDFYSVGALVLCCVLLVFIWSCCFGWNFDVIPSSLRVAPFLEAKLTRAVERGDLRYWLFLLLNIWVWGGALFYWAHNHWTFAQSFYYAAQAGWSVGFGALTEPDEWSEIYTIFHVCIGASFISAAIALFSTSAQKRQATREAYNFKKISTGNFAGHYQDDLKVNEKTLAAKFFMRKQTLTLLLFLFWITMGALFAHVRWGATFIQAIYFSITAVSTGGFYAPETDNCSMWFTGIFVLFGVPIFGRTLGMVAEIMTAPVEEANNELKLLNFRICHAEWVKAAGSDGEMNFEEFLKMFMKSYYGVTDQQMELLETRFKLYDDDNDGIITLAERLNYKGMEIV